MRLTSVLKQHNAAMTKPLTVDEQCIFVVTITDLFPIMERRYWSSELRSNDDKN